MEQNYGKSAPFSLGVEEEFLLVDPATDPQAELLSTVPMIDGEVTGFAGASKSALGMGGMRSKLRAARLVTAAGESVLMANGTFPNVLDRLFAAEPLGTLFLPQHRSAPGEPHPVVTGFVRACGGV